MSSIRAVLRRSPIAVSIYRGLKRVAHDVFPPDPAPPPAEPAPLAPAATTALHALSPAATPPAAGAAWKESDFDIYHQYPPHILYTFRDKDAVFREAVTAYANVSVEDEPSGLHTDPNRVLQLFQLIAAANRLPAGDYVEFGSHRGFSLRVIHKFMDPARTLYSFDTFEGFDDRDISVEQQKYDTPWTAGSFAPTSMEQVAKYVGDGIWPANLKIIKGWFPDSYRGLEDVRWRFVHVDFDLYQPIKAALERSWDQLLPGGVVVVHDYGCYGFPAARAAVDEFCDAVGVAPIELVDRWSSAAIRKPLR